MPAEEYLRTMRGWLVFFERLAGHVGDRSEFVDPDRAIDPLEADLIDDRSLDEIVYGHHRSLGDEDLTGFGPIRQAGREIDLVAEHGVVAARRRADVANRHPPGRDSDADLERLVVLVEPALPELGHPLSHLKSHPYGPLGVIILRDRIAEEDHHGVADVLVQRATVLENDLRHLR